MANVLVNEGSMGGMNYEIWTATLSGGTIAIYSKLGSPKIALWSYTAAPDAAIQPYFSVSGRTVTVTDGGAGDKTLACLILGYP